MFHFFCEEKDVVNMINKVNSFSFALYYRSCVSYCNTKIHDQFDISTWMDDQEIRFSTVDIKVKETNTHQIYYSSNQKTYKLQIVVTWNQHWCVGCRNQYQYATVLFTIQEIKKKTQHIFELSATFACLQSKAAQNSSNQSGHQPTSSPDD